MSLLGHLVPGWHPERAATIALAHILDLDASPGMASAFIDLVGETGSLRFDPHRVAPDLDQKDDSRPDVTIYDAEGKPRVFVEAAFWEGVPAAQPVDYLRELPGDLPSWLVYIAPRKRIRSLWRILRERCDGNPEIEVEEAPQTDEVIRAPVGARALLVTSWAYALETLQRVTQDPAVEQDIVQLRGLAKRMETAAFLPLEEDEAADAALARRLLCYRDLVDKIARRLKNDELATDVKYSQPSYRMQRDQGCAMRVHGKFELRFGISAECPKPYPIPTIHTPPFGNWGAWSRFGGRRDTSQFAGWKWKESKWQWNSCTTHIDHDPPQAGEYNMPRSAAWGQETRTARSQLGCSVRRQEPDAAVSQPGLHVQKPGWSCTSLIPGTGMKR